MPPPDVNLAIIGNLAIPEFAVILAGAVVLFGRQLPEVTMRGIAQVVRLRRAVADMWREAGLQEELRRVQQEVDLAASEARRPVLSSPATTEKGPTERPRAEDSGPADAPPALEATSEPVGPDAERGPDPEPS